MQNDTRFRNQNFSSLSISQHLDEYSKALQQGIGAVNRAQLEAAAGVVNSARFWGLRMFVCGNGGSASIADHLDCDFVKGTFFPDRPSLKVVSLVSNQALFSAIANDIGYDEVFSKQLEMAGAREAEILILISSSGNSPNIVKACEWANNKNMTTVGLSGFTGGELYKKSRVKLHVPVHNYGIVEDCHQMLMHSLAQFHELSLR